MKWTKAMAVVAGMIAVGAGLSPAMAAGGADVRPHRVGVGAVYWRAVEDVDINNVDQDGVSWMGSYQYRPGWVGAEVGVEAFGEGFGGASDTVLAPQAYLILGKGLYAAAGVGTYYTDGEFSNRPFYGLRAGLDAEILPFLRIDLNANYRFDDWANLSDSARDIGTDTVMLGAALRLAF